MQGLREFNKQLNSSDKNRFYFWESYRRLLTDFIIDNIKSNLDPVENVLIIGAGNCDDIDLFRLAKIVKNITLSDIDKSALNNVYKKFNIDKKNIEVKEIDYTGLDQNYEWNNLIDIILKDFSQKTITELFKNITYVSVNNKLSFNQEYDCVIVSPIYTQLLYPQISANVNLLRKLNYPESSINLIINTFLNFIPQIINNFNKNISSLLKQKGLAIIISDIFETTKTSKSYQEIIKIIDDLPSIEKYHYDYQKKYGIGLGDYGLSNIEEYLNIIKFKWFEWPFSIDKSIFVKSEILKK